VRDIPHIPDNMLDQSPAPCSPPFSCPFLSRAVESAIKGDMDMIAGLSQDSFSETWGEEQTNDLP